MNDDGARTAFEFLTFDGRLDEAEKNAEIMQKTNQKRRELVDASEVRIEQIISDEQLRDSYPLCIYCPSLHEGIIGIIAGNLAIRYQRPTIVFTDSNGIYKGSGRTYGGINLFDILNHCSEHFIKWGGHAEAAGMSVNPDHFHLLRQSLMDAYQNLGCKVQDEDDTFDLEITMEELPDMIHELGKYEPFGHRNPMIRFI